MDPNTEYEIINPPIESKEQIIKGIFKRKWICLFICFIIFFVGIDLTHVYYHEHAHGAIYDQYNVNYTYGWSFNGGMIQFYTLANDSSLLNCNEVCKSLQTENEIYTYNLAYIFYGIWTIAFLFLIKYFFDDVRTTYINLNYDGSNSSTR